MISACPGFGMSSAFADVAKRYVCSVGPIAMSAAPDPIQVWLNVYPAHILQIAYTESEGKVCRNGELPLTHRSGRYEICVDRDGVGTLDMTLIPANPASQGSAKIVGNDSSFVNSAGDYYFLQCTAWNE